MKPRKKKRRNARVLPHVASFRPRFFKSSLPTSSWTPCLPPPPMGPTPAHQPWGSTLFFFSPVLFLFSCVNSSLCSRSLALPCVLSLCGRQGLLRKLEFHHLGRYSSRLGPSPMFCVCRPSWLSLRQDDPSPHWLAFLPFCSVPDGAGDTAAWGPDGLGVSLWTQQGSSVGVWAALEGRP